MILREATYDNLNLKLVSSTHHTPEYSEDTIYITTAKYVNCGNVDCHGCPFDKSPGCSSGDISIDQICKFFDISAEDHPEYFI